MTIRRNSMQRRISRAVTVGLAAVVVLACVPPILVVLDRWYGMATLAVLMSPAWCLSPWLCATAWPAYFAAIFAAIALVVALVFILGADSIGNPELMVPSPTRQGSVPGPQWRVGTWLGIGAATGLLAAGIALAITDYTAGWDYLLLLAASGLALLLLTEPIAPIKAAILSHAPALGAAILGVSAVLMLLFGIYSRASIGLPAWLLSAAAAIALYRCRGRVTPGYWLMLLAFVLFTLQLNNWRFSFLGDEYAFYDDALLIARSLDLSAIGRRLFDGTFVYNNNPYLASLLQVPGLLIFDTHNFGWKISSIGASAVSVLFFYSFFRRILPVGAATLAGFLVAASQYLMSFSRIGHDITQAILAMSMAFAAAGWAIRRPRPIAFAVTGAATAYCFYTFPAALYALPAVLLLLLWFHPPNSRRAAMDWLLCAASALLIIMPLLFQPDFWGLDAKLQGTFLHAEPDPSSEGLPLPVRLLTKFAYAAFAFLYIQNESHYVASSHADPLTAALMIIGIAVALRRLRADRVASFAIFGLGTLLFFAGASHEYRFPPNTRMLLLVPFYALFAAIGVQWIGSLWRRLGMNTWMGRLALGMLVVAALALNLRQAYVINVMRSSGRYQYFNQTFVSLGQSLATSSSAFPQRVSIVRDSAFPDTGRLRILLSMAYLETEVLDVEARPTPGTEQVAALSQDSGVTIVSPRLPIEILTRYEGALDAAGMLSCSVRSDRGEERMRVWYGPSRPSPCAEPSNPSRPALQGAALMAVLLLAIAVAFFTNRRLGRSSRGRRFAQAVSVKLLSPIKRSWTRARHDLVAWIRSVRLAPGRWNRSPLGRRTQGRRPAGVASGSAPPSRRYPVDPAFTRSLGQLTVSLAGGMLIVSLLRQTWAKDMLVPWLGLVMAAFFAASALRRLRDSLPGRPLADALPTQPQAPRRGFGGVLVAMGSLLAAGAMIQLWTDHVSGWPLAAALWVASLFFLLIGTWHMGKVGQELDILDPAITLWPDQRSYRIAEWTAFLLIMALAVVLRAIHMDAIPPGVGRDVARAALSGLNILDGARQTPFYGLGTSHAPGLFLHFSAWVLRVFGPNWDALVLLASIPAILTVPAVYLLTKQLFGPLPALAAMLLIAVSRWHLTLSRTGWLETVSPLLEVLSLYCLLRAVRNRRAVEYALSGLLAGISLYGYMAPQLAIATLIIFALWVLLSRRGALRSHGAGVALLLLALLATAAPLAISDFRQPGGGYWIWRVNRVGVHGDIQQQQTILPLLQNVGDAATMFFQAGDRSGLHNLPGEPMLDPLTALWFSIGVVLMVLEWRDPRRVLLALWLIIGLAGSYLGARAESPQAARTLIVVPAVTIAAADVLDRCARAALRYFRSRTALVRRQPLPAFLTGLLLVVPLTLTAVWETSIYFGSQARSAEVARALDAGEAAAGREAAAAILAGKSVYMSPELANSPTVEFLTRGARKAESGSFAFDGLPVQTFDPNAVLPLPIDGKDALLLLDPEMQLLKDYFGALYPGTDFQLVSHADSQPMYIRVQVSKEELSALQGLTLARRYPDGSVRTELAREVVGNYAAGSLGEEWTGVILLRRSAEYTFQAGDGIQVLLDGQSMTTPGFLGSGAYHLQIVRPMEATGPVRLMWREGDGPWEPVPPGLLFQSSTPQNGLLAQFWPNETWSGEPLYHRIISSLALRWPADQRAVQSDGFSARFSGLLHVPIASTYEFRVQADDGARLLIDEQLLGEGLVPGRSNQFEAAAPLEPGPHVIQLDYFQHGGASGLSLWWRYGESKVWNSIPTELLTPATLEAGT